MLKRGELLREKAFEARFVLGAVLVMLGVVTTILVIFYAQQSSYSSTIETRDSQIRTLNALVGRLEVAYAALRDQDITLGIVPSTASLGDLISPPGAAKAHQSLLPRGFTATFPDGRFTCIDKTGGGNYFCTVERTGTTTTTAPSQP